MILVKEGEEEAKVTNNAAMDKLEAILMTKLVTLQTKIEQTENVEELEKLTKALSEILSSLEKIKGMKKS